jgi:hypothetical protein
MRLVCCWSGCSTPASMRRWNGRLLPLRASTTCRQSSRCSAIGVRRSPAAVAFSWAQYGPDDAGECRVDAGSSEDLHQVLDGRCAGCPAQPLKLSSIMAWAAFPTSLRRSSRIAMIGVS